MLIFELHSSMDWFFLWCIGLRLLSRELTRKISSFPSRLRYTQPRTVTFWSLHLPSNISFILTKAIWTSTICMYYLFSNLNAYRFLAASLFALNKSFDVSVNLLFGLSPEKFENRIEKSKLFEYRLPTQITRYCKIN